MRQRCCVFSMNNALPLSPERLAGEPSRWFARFVAYSRLPAAVRSIERVWRDERGASAKGSKRQRPSGAWSRACTRFRWHERAAALDADAVRGEAEEIAAVRKAERHRRRQASATFMARVSALAADAAAIRANPAGVARAVAIALEQSRLEFGGEPPVAATPQPPSEAVSSPALKIVFHVADGADSPPVSECGADAGFVFRRS